MRLCDTPLSTAMIWARQALPRLLPLQNTCAVARRHGYFFALWVDHIPILALDREALSVPTQIRGPVESPLRASVR